jgi:hypothetical protein
MASKNSTSNDPKGTNPSPSSAEDKFIPDQEPTFGVQPQPAMPHEAGDLGQGMLFAIVSTEELEQSVESRENVIEEYFFPSGTTQTGDRIEIQFDRRVSPGQEQSGEQVALTEDTTTIRRIAISDLLLRHEGFGGMVDTPGEQVWYCCKCLKKIRQNPPRFHRLTLTECQEHMCWHPRCHGGCVVQPANAPAPNWYLTQGRKWNKVVWAAGPPNWKPEDFQDLGFGEFPVWYCCRCFERYSVNHLSNMHKCVYMRNGGHCRHAPCRNCSDTPFLPQALQ